MLPPSSSGAVEPESFVWRRRDSWAAENGGFRLVVRARVTVRHQHGVEYIIHADNHTRTHTRRVKGFSFSRTLEEIPELLIELFSPPLRPLCSQPVSQRLNSCTNVVTPPHQWR